MVDARYSSPSRGRPVGHTLLTGVGALVAEILRGYGRRVERHHLEVVRQKVHLPRLPGCFHGTKVAQISDLHCGPFVQPRDVRVAVDTVMELQPHIVALTGDFVSRLTHGEAESLVQELSRLEAPRGVYAVLGNHDHWNDANAVASALQRAGVSLLRNSSARIGEGEDSLHIAGIDDFWEEQDDLYRALEQVPEGGCVILLAHEPQFAREAAEDGRVMLQLSGHSHGGQIRFTTRPMPFPTLAHQYPGGLTKVGDLQLYTNRGIGVVHVPLRINCPPEVTLLELVR